MRITLVLAAALLIAACDDPARDATPTPTAGASSPATATRAPEATPIAPSATAVARPPATPTRPPDTPVASPPQPPQPVPTATATVREPSATPPPLEAGRQRAPAPIDALSVRIAESSPPQVFLDVTTGLPGGCARFDSAVVARAGSVITLTMWNTMPTGAVACTAIYGYLRHTVPLGAFEPGIYTLRVNDQTRTFTIQ